MTWLRDIISAAMAAKKMMINEFPWDASYAVSGVEDVMTPALVVYADAINCNISRTLALLGGDADRWRVHIKTAKLGYTVHAMVERGVRNFKCATTLELHVACESGASDVLVAYPSVGANARRIKEISEQFPKVRVSVLAENEEQVRQWSGSRLGIFLDINSGMNRTGIEQNHAEEVVKLLSVIGSSGIRFSGLHYYDGHYGSLAEPERTTAAHAGYDYLMKIIAKVQGTGASIPEVITSGTPTFPCSLSYPGFRSEYFVHRISPGTVIYGDATSLEQLPKDYGYRAAALVLARVVSHPRPGVITCDAGHKAVSADAGIPTCVVAGHAELTPLTPSEEHLPMAIQEGQSGPQVGEALFLLPRHICPTVNNFDNALLVRNGAVESVQEVSARGREMPLLHALSAAVPAINR